MSFAAEMRDFFSAYKATSSIANDIRTKLDARKNTFDFDKAKNGAPDKPYGVDFGKGKKGKQAVPSPEIKKVIDENTPPELRDYAYKMAAKESSYNPSAVSPTGATGLFQFTGKTWVGTTGESIGAHHDGRLNPELNTKAFVKLTEQNRDYLRKALGREPSFGELALAHQQGAGGAEYLLTGRVPKGLNTAAIDKNLALNGIKGREGAAAKIASFYGFDLGDSSQVAQGESAIPVPTAKPTQQAGGDNSGQDDGSYSEAGSPDYVDHDAGIDISAIDVPDAPDAYQPVDTTEDPGTLYSAEGGSVPWAGATSRVSQRSYVPTYRPQQNYTAPSAIPSSGYDADGDRNNPKDMWGETNEDLVKNMSEYGLPYMQWAQNSGIGGMKGPGGEMFYAISHPHMKGDPRGTRFVGSNGFSYFYADGGPVNDEEAIPVTSEGKANRDTLPPGYGGKSDPVAPGNVPPAPAGEGVSLGKALDLGFKHLTNALGLNHNGAAVGDDPELQNRQKKLVNGAIGPNEGPPSQQEVQQAYQLVDPDNQLHDGLKTVYAMQKGVEFYLARGDVEKAGKWAAGLIQYSNLMARRYGYEAVQAGKSGDMDGMVNYAIKAYESIPDGMTVDALRKGNGVEVTRSNQDGEVVDQHFLSPQQIFQMATGISQGSGYFEALMPLADPTGETTRAKKAEQAQGWSTKADDWARDFDRIKDSLTPGEAAAVQSAIDTGRQTGDFGHAQQLIASFAARSGKKDATGKQAQYLRDAAKGVRMSSQDQARFDSALENEQWSDADAILKTYSDKSAKEAKAVEDGKLKTPKLDKDYQGILDQAGAVATTMLGGEDADPAEVAKAQGPTFTKLRDLIANIASLNDIPVDTAAQIAQEVGMSDKAVTFEQSSDASGNLVLKSSDGTEVKLPATARVLIDGLRLSRIPKSAPEEEQPKARTWSEWWSNAPAGKDTGATQGNKESAIPSYPGAENAHLNRPQGKPLAAADLEKAKSAIARGANPEAIKNYLRQQGFSTEGL